MPSKADHKPTGKQCTRCGLSSSRHRVKRNRQVYTRAYNKAHPRPNASERIIFIDGEGQGRAPHVYNYLAACDESGEVWELGDDPTRQLATADVLDFMLELPARALVFSFAFLYDLTKGLTDLPDLKLYLVFHEKRRMQLVDGRVQYRAVRWNPSGRLCRKSAKCDCCYSINYMHRRFTVSKGTRRVTVWDIFAFFQSRFTKALIDWQIGDPKLVTLMEGMKERRSTFDAQSFEEIKKYCQTECRTGAELGRALIDAHLDAGYKLTSYFGAGSTATALMKAHNVKSYMDEVPEGMKEAIACAFAGGRFENSVIGPIKRKVWNNDISNAYPYAATFLPCLTHGRWKLITKKVDAAIEGARLACVKWSLPGPYAGNRTAWGPLPVRKADGTIAFPLVAPKGGWVWREEYLAAKRYRPDCVALGAWIYKTDCDCQPFSFLPDVYLERLRIGSDAKGIVLKLGGNSVYGKLVQSVGWDPPFQSWVWGGNITSSCRAQLIDAIRLAPTPQNVLMLATDGVWSDAPIDLPKPRDTGTAEATVISKGKKGPLGGWDVKTFDQGVFAARPGIYFPLEPTEADLEKVRARGLGRRVLYDNWRTVVDAFLAGEPSVLVRGGQRFVGAKTGMSWFPKVGVRRSPHYGEWIDWPTYIGFDPRPKRCGIVDGRLTAWPRFDVESLPYKKAIRSEEDLALELAQTIAEEQPNADFSETE